MASAKQTGSIFDDEDDDGIPTMRAKRGVAAKGAPDNPLSFFSFGSAPAASTPASKPTAAKTPSHVSEDEDDDDDEFFKSPPSSIKKPAKRSSVSSFDLDDEDDLDLGKHGLDTSMLPNLSFKAAINGASDRPASADPTKSGSSENSRIAALEEQLAKANRSIKKFQDKEKADAEQLEQALQGIETNIAKHVERANKAESSAHRLEKELSAMRDQVAQLQTQNRQQAAIISQMNLGGIPIPNIAPAELDWHTVQEKHQLAVRMLTQASQEAQTGLELLTKNVPVLADLASLLKDLGKISDERTR